jgi:hypothetical protein
MAITRDEFVALMSPQVMQFLHETIHGSITDYDDPTYYSPTARRDHTKSVRAAIRNCHMIGRAKRALIDAPNLHIRHKRRGNRDYFILADRVRIFYKKLNQNKRPSNYPTEQAMKLLEQKWPPQEPAESPSSEVEAQPLWDMQAIPIMDNVIAGYVANASETAFSLHVICPAGPENDWELDLDETDIQNIIELAATAPDAVAEEVAKKVRKRRVTPRGKPATAQGADDHVS